MKFSEKIIIPLEGAAKKNASEQISRENVVFILTNYCCLLSCFASSSTSSRGNLVADRRIYRPLDRYGDIMLQSICIDYYDV